MVSELPAPLVPPFVDLRDFRFMPLIVEQLRRSKQWLIAKRRPEIGFYSVNLWTASWHNLPAGSLEDDDDVLADAAMCRPDLWDGVKGDVLRGWIRCSDGRLYHPIVCAEAANAWNDKARHRWRKECDRIKKDNYRRSGKGLPPLDMPDPPPVIFASIPSIKPSRTSPGHPRDIPGTSLGHPWDVLGTSPGHPRDIPGTSPGHPWDAAVPGTSPGHPRDIPGTSPRHTGAVLGTSPGQTPFVTGTETVCPRENALKGQGQGQGQGQGKYSASELSLPRELARSPEFDLRLAIVEAFREAGQEIPPETGHCAVWLAQGYPADLCLSVIRSKLPMARDKGLKWFDKAIAEAFAKRASSAAGADAAPAPEQRPAKRPIWAFGKWTEMRPEFEPPPPERLEFKYPFERASGCEDRLIAMPSGGYRWVSQYRAHLRRWVEGGKHRHLWSEMDFGADPTEPACRAPDDLLAEFGLTRVPYPLEEDEFA